jgi:hypothetical protein
VPPCASKARPSRGRFAQRLGTGAFPGLLCHEPAEVIRGGLLLEVAGTVSSTSSPHTIRGRCYGARNPFATIRAAMLAKKHGNQS